MGVQVDDLNGAPNVGNVRATGASSGEEARSFKGQLQMIQVWGESAIQIGQGTVFLDR